MLEYHWISANQNHHYLSRSQREHSTNQKKKGKNEQLRATAKPTTEESDTDTEIEQIGFR